MDEFVQIGTTKKTHGFRGELRIRIEDAYWDDFLESKVLFIELDGHPAPFFVEDLRSDANPIIKLDEIDTVEDAKPIAGKPVYLRSQDIHVYTEDSEVGEELEFYHLLHYTIIDETAGKLGPIQSIESYPEQEIAIIEYQGQDLLIPLHHQLILSFDHTKKEVRMALPEGLLEL
jgi:16S rRNA processing protein RimM